MDPKNFGQHRTDSLSEVNRGCPKITIGQIFLKKENSFFSSSTTSQEILITFL